MAHFRRILGIPLCKSINRTGNSSYVADVNYCARGMSIDAPQSQQQPNTNSRLARSPGPSRSPRTRRRYVSRLFQNFSKIQPDDLGACKSFQLMLYNEIIDSCYPGAFHLLPLGQRAMEKLTRIIDQEMDAAGGQKISMPTLAPDSLWKASGRWESTGKELFKIKDRHGHEFCLGPTHEEVITSLLASQSPVSSQQLPQLLYQITRKFRDEMAPKHGLLRGREFEMKDMYTFDTDEESAMETYHSITEAYCNIFDRIGVPYEQVRGSTGNIGGSLSHEFHYLADVGEDRLLLCQSCGLKMNEEMAGEQTQMCQGNQDLCELRKRKGIEVGHCFYLGTKYSSVFDATYVDSGESIKPIHMGCFGLGVTRILQASVEVLSKERQLRWPSVLAPYQVCIVPQKEGFQAELYFNLAEELSDELSGLPNLAGEVVIDDRVKLSIGRRIYEASRLGYPYILVLGKKALAEPCQVEVIATLGEDKQYMSREQLRDFMSSVATV